MALIEAPASFLEVMTQADVWLERTDFETRSAFNKKRQVISYPSASMWRISMSVFPQLPEDARLWRKFVFALRGRENWFQCPQPLYPGPDTGYTGSVLVDGAGQTGFTLNLRGMPAGADILAAGDMFTVVDQCFIATADVTADGLGKASVSFDTPLRTSPADGAAVNIASPYFLAASVTSNAARWTGAEVDRSAFTFEGAEHF